MTGRTAVYDLEYPLPGEPIRVTRGVLQRNAEKIEAGLVAKGVPAPGASDLAAVAGRVNLLETAPVLRVHRRAVQNHPGGFLGTGILWDSLIEDSAGMMPSLAPASGAPTPTPDATVRRAGVYEIKTQWLRQGAGHPSRLVTRVDLFSAAGVLRSADVGASGSANYQDPSVLAVGEVRLAVGERLRVSPFHDQGSAATIGHTDWAPTFLTMRWVRP